MACRTTDRHFWLLQVAQGALALLGFYVVLHCISFSALILVSRRKQS